MKNFLNNVFKKILNTENKLNIAKNSGWLILYHGIKIIFGLLVGVWVARYLGPVNYGKLSYIIALVLILTPLYTLGLDYSIPKEFIHNKENKWKILKTVFFLKFIGGFLIFVLSLAIVFFFHGNDNIFLLLALFIGFSYIFKSFEVFDIWFLNKLKSKYTVIARSFGLVFSGLLKVAFILSGCSVVYFGFTQTIEFFVVAVVLTIIFIKTEPEFNFKQIKINFKQSFDLLKKSWIYAFLGFTYVIMSNIDKIMIKNIVGSYDVGLYTVANTLPLYFIVMGGFISQSVYPVLLRLEKNRQFENYKQDFQKLFNYMAVLAYIISILTAFNADFIVKLIWGSEYEFSGKILSVLIIYVVFLFLGSTGAYWTIFIKNLIKFHLIAFSCCIALNIILNYFLLKHIGVLGAAYATVISYFLLYIMADLFYNKTKTIFKMKIKALFMFDLLNIIFNKLKRKN